MTLTGTLIGMREDDGYNHTNLMGVFDIDVTGNHIDRFYGAYWWD